MKVTSARVGQAFFAMELQITAFPILALDDGPSCSLCSRMTGNTEVISYSEKREKSSFRSGRTDPIAGGTRVTVRDGRFHRFTGFTGPQICEHRPKRFRASPVPARREF